MNEQAINVMLALIRKVVRGAEVSEKMKNTVTVELLPQLYAISKLHDMAHIVSQGLEELGLLGEDEMSAKFRKQQMLAVYRYQRMHYELEQICKTLEEARILFIPLKGAVIRQYYPEPWMRTSCDIDLLVHEESLDEATYQLSEKLQYKSNFIGPHDVSMYTPSGVHVEIHYDLIEEKHIGKADSILKDVWCYAASAQNSVYKLSMSDDFLYFYHLAHMAKHIRSGGCGIRPLLDLYILNHLAGFQRENANAILIEGELKALADEANKLSEFWFGEPNDIYLNETGRLLQTYILQAGTYGTQVNSTIVNHVSEKGAASNKKLWEKIWKPYDRLKYWYPILNKHKWLMPFYQVKRWFKLLFGGTVGQLLSRKKVLEASSPEAVSDIQQLLRQLGLE